MPQDMSSMPVDDIIAGRTEHKTFAPLSGGQTLELARLLRDENRALQANLGEVQKDLGDTNGGLSGAQNDIRELRAAMQQMQAKQSNMDKKVDSHQRELDRNGEVVKQLQGDLGNTINHVKKTMENMKHFETKMDQVCREGDEVRSRLKTLQSDLERNFEGDKSDRGEFNEVSNKLFRSQEAAAKGLEEARAMQQGMDALIRKLDGDFEKQKVLIRSLEERVADAARNLKETSQHLDETSLKGARLEEDHDRTKANLMDVSEHTRKLLQAADKLGDELRQQGGELGIAQANLGYAQETLRSHASKIQGAESGVRKLGEGHKSLGGQLQQLQQSLSHTHAIAQQAQQGLRETNAIMLPNIAMDNEAVHALGRSIDLGSMGGGMPVSTPRGGGGLGGSGQARPRAGTKATPLSSLLSPLSSTGVGDAGATGGDRTMRPASQREGG